jgi:putative nucleotidyltransferase-like protein
MSIADYVALAKEIGFGTPQSAAGALAALPGPPEQVADALRSHHLLGFAQRAVRDAGEQAGVPRALQGALASRRPIQRAAPETLLATFDEVRRTLEGEGVEALLLKGLVLADRLYGGIDRRPQFDVDVLVRWGDLRRAARALRRAGFAPQAYDLHSRTVIRDDLKVDLHGALRRAPAYRLDEDCLWSARRWVAIGDLSVPTLGDEHSLLLLLLAAFEDLGQGTANLKQVLDVALLARALEPDLAWQEFLARRAEENLLEVSANALAVVLDALDLRPTLPRLDAALAPHARCLRHRDRAAALDLLAAPPKSAASLRWFASVYPGSMALWLAWFWASGFPANLSQLGGPWLSQALAVAGQSLRPRLRPPRP